MKTKITPIHIPETTNTKNTSWIFSRFAILTFIEQHASVFEHYLHSATPFGGSVTAKG